MLELVELATGKLHSIAECRFESQLLCFLLMCLGLLAHVFGSLLFVWETQMEFRAVRAPGFGLASTGSCRHLSSEPANGRSSPFK